MAAIPEPGSVWRDRNPSSLHPDYRHLYRRLVRVESAEEHGFVAGVGWWQKRDGEAGEWADETYPGTKRKTRARTNLFLKRFDPLPPTEES